MIDKLIELLEKAESAVYWDSSDQSFINKIADFLIANGVTFAKDNNVPCKKPMTNGDRIRAMSDEGLAEFLMIFNWDRDVSNFVCDMCAKKERYCGKDMDGACPISNMAAALMWLRHEARVDHDRS